MSSYDEDWEPRDEEEDDQFDQTYPTGYPIPITASPKGLPSTDDLYYGGEGDSGNFEPIKDITFPNGSSLLRRGSFGFEPSNAYSEYVVTKPHRVAVRELSKYWAERGLIAYPITRYDLSFTVNYGGRSIPILMRESDYRDKAKREAAIQNAIQSVQWADSYNYLRNTVQPDYFPNIDWGSSEDNHYEKPADLVYTEIANPGQLGFSAIGAGLQTTTNGSDGDDYPDTSDLDLDDPSLYSDPNASDDDPVDYGDFAGMF